MKVRSALIVAVSLTVLGPFEAEAHRHIPRDVVSSFVEAWNANDVSRMAGLFEADADLYYPFASFVIGREGIVNLLQKERAKESQLRLADLLRERQFWHWAVVDFKATLQPKNGQPLPVVLSAVVVQTKVAATPADHEWSFSSLRVIPDHARGTTP